MKIFVAFDSLPPAGRMRRAAPLLVCLVTGALLGGCQTARMPPAAPPPPVVSAELKAAEEAERAGEYLLAAHAYERAAEQATSPQRESLVLKAVGALIQAGQIREARERLARLDLLRLGAPYRARKLILEARLLAFEGAHERAIRRLDEAAQWRPLDPALLAEIHQVRAEEELALDNPIGAVRNYIERERYIVEPQAVVANQTQLWRILTALPRARLRTELDLARDPVLAGWLELALIAAEQGGRPQALERGITEWRARHPRHPAAASLLEEILRQQPSLIGRVTRVAVLLPLSSDYALAAQAVRDGLLAMHAADPSPDKPQVEIYDTGADPAQVLEAYRQAVRAGAEFVIGPLGREAATLLARRGEITVPTLLLSHLDDEKTGTGLLLQFGLPPEQEARAAAERAWLDGRRRAALLYPANAWGERMANAFRTHWQRLGGLVVAAESYDERASDHSGPIQRLLNIAQSFARKERLESILRTRLVFDAGTARRRQDVDMIFLAADARSGRLVKPQLDYYQAADIPVYATSHLFAGRPDPVHDVDLNDVYFSDMPWMLVDGGRIETLRARLQGHGWPYARSDLDRLYALGVDSYAVIPHLNRLRLDPNARYGGVTGFLSLDPHGRLQRQTLWARFRRGVPRLLDRFLGPEESPPAARSEPGRPAAAAAAAGRFSP